MNDLVMFYTFVQPLLLVMALAIVAGATGACLAFAVYFVATRQVNQRDEVAELLDGLTDRDFLERAIRGGR